MSQPQEIVYYFFCQSASLFVASRLFFRLSTGGQQQQDALVGRWKLGTGRSVGFPWRLRVSSWCPGTDSQHRLLPWELGWAVETAPTDLTAFHPPLLCTSRSMAGSAALKREWGHSYCCSELLAARRGPWAARSGCRRWSWTQLKAPGLFRSWCVEGTGNRLQGATQACRSSTLITVQQPVHAVRALAWGDTTSRILPCRVWHLKREGDSWIPFSSWA